jgi:hypothetical protein
MGNKNLRLEMDAILLIIGIAYGVFRIVIKSVQQCNYFLFSVNLLLVGVNYGQRTLGFQISTPGQSLSLSISESISGDKQVFNDLSDVVFVV